MRKMLSLAIVAVLLLGACSSDGGDDTEATSDDAADEATPEPTEEPTEEPTAEPTPEPTEEPTEEPVEEPAEEATPEPTEEPSEPAATATSVEVVLTEWAIDAPESYTAGTIEFTASNIGDFPHEFVVARADSVESLPTLTSGAVDEDALGADLIGRIERIADGSSGSGTFDLAPGSYVLFCNIAVGPNSHFANGQALAVTVG